MEYYSCKDSKVDIFLESLQKFLEQFRATAWVSQVVICLMFNLWCLMFQVWYFGVFSVKLNLFHVFVAQHEQIFFIGPWRRDQIGIKLERKVVMYQTLANFM